MYRCIFCKHLFSDFLAVKSSGKPIPCCPWCGARHEAAFVEVCSKCHRYYKERYLYGGFCMSCLREQIDYATGLRYLLARSSLREFMETADGPISARARTPDILEAFLRNQTEDMGRFHRPFLTKLRDYITADRICAKDFGDWLEGRDPS